MSVSLCETWSCTCSLSLAKSYFIHPASYPCFEGWVRSRRVEPHVALLSPCSAGSSQLESLGSRKAVRSCLRFARVGLCWRLIFEPTLKFASSEILCLTCHFGCGVKDPVEYLCILDMSLYKSQTRMLNCWLQRCICCGNESMFLLILLPWISDPLVKGSSWQGLYSKLLLCVAPAPREFPLGPEASWSFTPNFVTTTHPGITLGKVQPRALQPGNKQNEHWKSIVMTLIWCLHHWCACENFTLLVTLEKNITVHVERSS